jgi:hypothetical protein
MIATSIRSRVDGMRRTGTNRWLQRRPVHHEKRRWSGYTVGGPMVQSSSGRSHLTPNHRGKTLVPRFYAVWDATIALSTPRASRG